jgi:aldehyde dehydrogenase (NAD+)
MQFVHGNLPFGGVNNSGIGNSHGHFGFKAFSHERAVVKASKLMMVRLFFPPYDESRRKIIRMTVDSMKWPML